MLSCIHCFLRLTFRNLKSRQGRKVIGIFGSLIWSKTQIELIFNACGEFRWNPEGPVGQIHSLHLHVSASGIFPDLLRSVQVLKRQWGAESNGKLPHVFIPRKTARVFSGRPAFGQSCNLGSCVWVKNLPLGRILRWWWWWWWWWWWSRDERWAGRVAHVEKSRNTHRILLGRPDRKWPLGWPRRKGEDNVKMNLREADYDAGDWIGLAQDRVQWRAYVIAVMDLRVP